MLHTGDITHLSKPEEFDTVDQLLKSASAKDVFYVPGEHDVLGDDGKQYLERYGKERQGRRLVQLRQKGVHFIGLVNVMNLKAGGLGSLGNEQLEWLEKDVKHLCKPARPSWCSRTSRCGRFIRNGAGAPTTARRRWRYLKRFGSVTVLNGHIHQTMQKVEGNVTFHTAAPRRFRNPSPELRLRPDR